MIASVAVPFGTLYTPQKGESSMKCKHESVTETWMNAETKVRICNECGGEMLYRVTDDPKEVEKRWKWF